MTRSPFIPTQDLALFFSDPGNRVRVGRSFCFWQSSARVHGSIAWGKATEQDVVEMCDVFDALLRSPLAKQPSIIDIRALQSVNIVAFDRFVRTLSERRSAWRTRTGRQAIVHAGGFTGALILGALQIAASGYELAVFEDLHAAFAWVGRPEAEPEVAALRASLLEPPDVVRRVRTALDAHDRPLSAQALARSLGLSTRTLQRHLGAVGTSVRAERDAHVLARAERLLEGTEFDLTAIASMLGLRSPARLVSLFRAVRRTTPGAWRRAAR
ncbi:MAG: helix-turn-helix domain-containing protein [Myxococcaceae bacterium]